MISITHNLLFIHIPKTAGKAIQRSLLPFSEDHIALISPHHDGIELFNIHSPHSDVVKHSNLAEHLSPSDTVTENAVEGLLANPFGTLITFVSRRIDLARIRQIKLGSINLLHLEWSKRSSRHERCRIQDRETEPVHYFGAGKTTCRMNEKRDLPPLSLLSG